MKRALLEYLAGITALAVLLGVLYAPVLLHDRQFVGGNAAYFDYPLFRFIQQQWKAGRLPLWNPLQNGGAPLLGNPMAAVLYPGKLLYAVFPFVWATRLQVILHTVIACLGARLLCKGLEVSPAGAILGGLVYGFGAIMLGQHCNTNLMVGAAWTPWGLHAVDLAFRSRGRRGTGALAVILAMQVLGGDPQAAYLTAFCGAGYALPLSLQGKSAPRWFRFPPILAALAVLWIAATFALSRMRGALPSFRAIGVLVLLCWMVLGLILLWRYRQGRDGGLAVKLSLLLGASVLALGLAAAQVLPGLEFTGKSWRAAGLSGSEIYRYSLHPCRLAELAWPHIFGVSSDINRSWLQAVPAAGGHDIWIKSLYMGGLTIALAIVGAAGKSSSLSRAGLITLVLAGFLASFGKYTSPLWWSSSAAATSESSVASQPGGDPEIAPERDGFGSLYGLLATILPGFGAFRYPTKLVIFPAVGLAVLAGMGWDRVLESPGGARSLQRIGTVGLGLSLLALVVAVLSRDRMIEIISHRVALDVMLGPVDAPGAWRETERSLVHGAVVFAAVVALANLACVRPRFAAVAAMLVMVLDLGTGNARVLETVPRLPLDEPSEAAVRIADAERSLPLSGPFRIHRMPGGWFPGQFATSRSADRNHELITWARDTLLPLYGLPQHLEYVTTSGSLELDDHLAFFEMAPMPAPPSLAQVLNVPPGQPITYFPRRSYDLWGARYFILPAWPDWGTHERGIAAFLEHTELVYPSAEELHSQNRNAGESSWALTHDWQVRRNLTAYPRAWIVHFARIRPEAADPETRSSLMRSLLFMNDAIWREKDHTVLDLHRLALIETEDRRGLERFLSPTEVDAAESVTVVTHEPQRVELKARLLRPGLVILADTYYPGWHLTVDGNPAPIYRANRLMRGAAVEAGKHTLVYTYEPPSFRLGVTLSAGAGLTLLALCCWPRRRLATPLPRQPEEPPATTGLKS